MKAIKEKMSCYLLLLLLLLLTFTQAIKNQRPQADYLSKHHVSIVAVFLWLQTVVHLMLFPMTNILPLQISTFPSM